MLKSRQSLLAIVLIVCLLLILAVRLWANAQAVAITGPMQLKRGGDARIYVAVAERLMVFSESGELIERIPLSRFGVDNVFGDFIVNAHKEILLRGPRPDNGMLTSLRVMLRIGGDGRDQATGGVLQWCALSGGPCRPFASDFRSVRTFRMAAEEQTGAVFIADTAQHRLLRLNKAGTIEKTNSQEFKFPNGVLLANDGRLFLADTNHHRVVALESGVQEFGAMRHAFPVQTAESSFGRIWPTALTQTTDGSIWVVNGDNNMAYSDLMQYDANGHFRKKIPLPPGADPIALLAVNGAVIVTDPIQFGIYTFDLEGNKLGNFGGGDFYLEMNALKNKRSLYKNISNGALLILVGLLVAAYSLYRKNPPKK